MKLQSSSRIHGAAGFTLVELLTTMVIVGVLVSIAMPAYTSQTRKSRRTEARTAVLDLAGREERLFSTTNAYSATASDLGYGGGGATFPMDVGSGYYNVSIAIAAGPPATFTITASPVSGKGQEKDTQCASFTVVQTGKQSALNSSGADASASCWG
jgi:type IV pilus assembly protein PilE